MPTLVSETPVLKATISGSNSMQQLTLFRAIQFILPNNCYIQVIYPIKYISPTGLFFDAMPFFAHTAGTSDQCRRATEQHSKKGPVRSKTFHDQIRFSTVIIHILNLMTQIHEGSLFYKNMHFQVRIHTMFYSFMTEIPIIQKRIH